jgi:hypothetical protein
MALLTKVFFQVNLRWTQNPDWDKYATIVADSEAVPDYRLDLVREEQARWNELHRFRLSHQENLTEYDAAELRRLRTAWAEAAQALFALESPNSR